MQIDYERKFKGQCRASHAMMDGKIYINKRVQINIVEKPGENRFCDN